MKINEFRPSRRVKAATTRVREQEEEEERAILSRPVTIILRLHKKERIRKVGVFVLTAFNFFVGQVGAIAVSIAEFRPLDAFRAASGRSLRAEELVVRAPDQRAVGLVGIVGAVGETVAPPPVREAKSIVAPELTAVTRREICREKRKKKN
jgi:hypothetical protein